MSEPCWACTVGEYDDCECPPGCSCSACAVDPYLKDTRAELAGMSDEMLALKIREAEAKRLEFYSAGSPTGDGATMAWEGEAWLIDRDVSFLVWEVDRRAKMRSVTQ